MSELDLLIEKLSHAQRKRLPSKDFVFPDADGKGGRWPIQSAKQALIAIDFMRKGRGKESEYGEIRKAIESRFGRNKKVMAALNSTNEAIEEQEGLEEATKLGLNELSPHHEKQAKAIAKLLNGKIVEVWEGIHGKIVVVKSDNPRLSADKMKILSRTVRWIDRGKHDWSVGFE
jgi:hypothetical protein